jgi:PAS domain S-box-containing protein
LTSTSKSFAAAMPLNPVGPDDQAFSRAEALHESERQFRSLADNMSQLAWIADPGGRIYWYNQRWYSYTGTSHEAMMALGWRSLYHPDHLQRVESRLRRCFATGSIWEDTFPLRGKDGLYRWFLSRALPIRDESGNITYWLGTSTDITAQVKAEDALRELNESLELRVAERTRELADINQRLQIEISERAQAEEALRHAQKMDAIGQLTGGIAHDFNNMLTGVLGALDLIQRRVAAGRVSEIDRYIDAAMSSANRAASLTHRLLAFARRQSLNPRPVDVNRMVVSMEELLRRTIGESIELEVDLNSALRLTNTDEHQLENALLNLVINARDAMPDGGRLLIQTELAHVAVLHDSLAPGDYVRLGVQDTGCGMSGEVIARAFDPFFTTKPIGQGTGLGLSMVYGFINQTGGQVLIDSSEGRGTRVDLYLPCHFQPVERQAVADDSVDPPRAVQGERVLVVEDEPDVRMLVVDVLRDLGYTVEVASDSHTALPFIQSPQRIDLLVTDVGLPGLNGRQLAEIARQHRPGLRVLFITGYAPNAEIRGDFLDEGMDMLTKPFSIDALAQRVRSLIEPAAQG